MYIGFDKFTIPNEKTISREAGTNGYLTKTAHQKEQKLFDSVKRILALFYFVCSAQAPSSTK